MFGLVVDCTVNIGHCYLPSSNDVGVASGRCKKRMCQAWKLFRIESRLQSIISFVKSIFACQKILGSVQVQEH